MRSLTEGLRWAVLSVLALASLASSQPAEGADYVPNQVLLRFEDGASASCRDSAIASVGGTVVDSLGLISYYVVQLPDTAVIAAIAELDSQYCVHAVQTNGLADPDSFPMLSPNDTHYSFLNHLKNTGQDGGTSGADIDAEGGWSFINDASNVVIAIMDTGVDYYHEDLAGNMWLNPGETGLDGNGQNKQTNGIDDDANGYADDIYGWKFVAPQSNAPWDHYHHGTGTAGFAAARGDNAKGVTGVAWRAKIMILQVVKKITAAPYYESADEAGMVAAVQYAVANGADVLNVSLTYPPGKFGQAFRSAFIAAGTAGLVITCGSGNSGGNNDIFPTIPSTINADGVIAVGGVDRDDEFAYPCPPTPGEDDVYSNYGATQVDLAAPACNLFTMYPVDEYDDDHSGTSAAAPMVAGAAALLIAQNPTWTNVQVKNRLMATIDTLTSCIGKMVAPGRLNLERALDNVRPSPVSLTVESVARWSQAISWTTTGDDGTSGQARNYVLKRSTSPITTQQEFNAAPTAAEGTPGTSGTYHCIEIDSLSQCTTYYWSLQLEDNAFNVSNLATNVSAATTCSGNMYVLCDGGGLLQGGDGGGGGGGEGMFRRGAFGTYAEATAGIGIESTPATREGVGGWVAENRIQSGVGEVPSTDLLELRGAVRSHSGEYLARVLQAGNGSLTVSSARLGVLDRRSGASAAITMGGVAVGREIEVLACQSADGANLTRYFSGGEGRVSGAGEALIVSLPSERGATYLVIEAAAAPAAVDAAHGDLEVQRQVGGAWETLGNIMLRQRLHRVAVDLNGAQEVRLVAHRPAMIRAISGLSEAQLEDPTWLAPSSVRSAGVERRDAFLGGGAPIVLTSAEDVVFAFAAEGVGEGMERSLYFSVESRRTAGTPLDPSTASKELDQLSFGLRLARPNPTFGNATFSYVLPSEMAATIRIYDATGRLVRTISQGVRLAGQHEAFWDGRSDSGMKASAGVYFYRLEAGGRRTERKLVVLAQ